MKALLGLSAAALLLVAALPAEAAAVAVLQGLDKMTAQVSQLDVPIDQPVAFGTLVITVKACVKRPPEEPPETAAFLIIDEKRPGGTAPGAPPAPAKQVFSGWMFASSPGISALEDPIYDVTVLDCKASTTPAPASGSTGK